jgi:hypothetical protein
LEPTYQLKIYVYAATTNKLKTFTVGFICICVRLARYKNLHTLKICASEMIHLWQIFFIKNTPKNTHNQNEKIINPWKYKVLKSLALKFLFYIKIQREEARMTDRLSPATFYLSYSLVHQIQHRHLHSHTFSYFVELIFVVQTIHCWQ